MTGDELLQLFRANRVLLEGHFRLTSGKHSAGFLQCSQLMQDPAEAGRVCAAMAGLWRGADVATVAGPAMGGVILAYEVARALGARAIFTEKEGDLQALRRGFAVSPGERVLVVEDAVTTGGSARATLEALRREGANVVGVGALVDRSGGAAQFGVPFQALLSLELPAYDPAGCPLCALGLPLVQPKRAKA